MPWASSNASSSMNRVIDVFLGRLLTQAVQCLAQLRTEAPAAGHRHHRADEPAPKSHGLPPEVDRDMAAAVRPGTSRDTP